MRHRQRGMTFLGLLIVLALAGAVGYGVVRLFPVYLNYMKVVSSLKSVATEFKGGGGDESSIRAALARRWNIEDITGVDYKEIEIKKDNGELYLHALYDDKVPYIANISLTASFDTSVKVE
ncbi:MAG: DUF4845 domain-containing protein [Steroidobacteraceae bacterium]